VCYNYTVKIKYERGGGMNEKTMKKLKEYAKERRGLHLNYSVSEKNIPESMRKQNKEDLQLMQEALAMLGVVLKVKEGELSLRMDALNFVEKKTRSAGRKRTYALKEQEQGNYTAAAYKFSDVVSLIEEKGDKETQAILRMSESTYFRHKKKMKSSEYYASLDPEKMTDQEYLESVPGNNYF
jgi:superfamily II DNA helicase RecQ